MHVRPVKADITPCLKPIPLIILVKEEEPLHCMEVEVHVHHNKTIFSIEDAAITHAAAASRHQTLFPPRTREANMPSSHRLVCAM